MLVMWLLTSGSVIECFGLAKCTGTQFSADRMLWIAGTSVSSTGAHEDNVRSKALQAACCIAFRAGALVTSAAAGSKTCLAYKGYVFNMP